MVCFHSHNLILFPKNPLLMTQDDLVSTLLGSIYRELLANTDFDDFPETG